jgi:hypothetical protein
MRAKNPTRIPDRLALSRSDPMIELLKGRDKRSSLARLCIDHMHFRRIKRCGTAEIVLRNRTEQILQK